MRYLAPFCLAEANDRFYCATLLVVKWLCAHAYMYVCFRMFVDIVLSPMSGRTGQSHCSDRSKRSCAQSAHSAWAADRCQCSFSYQHTVSANLIWRKCAALQSGAYVLCDRSKTRHLNFCWNCRQNRQFQPEVRTKLKVHVDWDWQLRA